MSTYVSANLSVVPKSILVADDFSDMSSKALEYAAALGKRFGSYVTLVHVTEPLSPIVPPEGDVFWDVEEQKRAFELQLDRGVKELRAAGLRADRVEASGSIPEELIATARGHSSDLMIVGTHAPKGLGRLILGSVSEEVLVRSGCPVMVVGPNTLPATAGAWSPRHLMALVALSHEGLKAIVHSFHLAREVGASLDLFMIFDRENTVDHKDWQFLRLALAEKLPGVDIEKELPHECVPRDQAVHRVLDLSSLREADAIIVSEECGGSKHPHFQRDIISRLSAESRCPLIVVPRDQPTISS